MNQSPMDRYGYYQIGDFKTYSVYQMMDYYLYRRFNNRRCEGNIVMLLKQK